LILREDAWLKKERPETANETTNSALFFASILFALFARNVFGMAKQGGSVMMPGIV
jgi:hypothetical protein